MESKRPEKQESRGLVSRTPATGGSEDSAPFSIWEHHPEPGRPSSSTASDPVPPAVFPVSGSSSSSLLTVWAKPWGPAGVLSRELARPSVIWVRRKARPGDGVLAPLSLALWPHAADFTSPSFRSVICKTGVDNTYFIGLCGK